MRLGKRIILAAMLTAVIVVVLPVLPARILTIRAQVTYAEESTREKCRPWQHKDENDKCVDDVGAIHLGPGSSPPPGKQCWVECECRDGQSPGSGNCGSCSNIGIVCL